jgi:Fe-S oxidoreductase
VRPRLARRLCFWNTLTGIGAGANDPFAIQLQKQLDPNYKQPSHICEVTWDLIQAGRLKFNKEANDHRIVTFHDSCNVARGSRMGDYAGGQFDIPRNIIRAVANHYVDMSEATTREKTFCCGGGGGLLTDELLDLRVKGALPRMEALKRDRRQERRELHGHHLRHLQGAVHQGAALLRIQDGHGRRRAPAGQHRHRAQ